MRRSSVEGTTTTARRPLKTAESAASIVSVDAFTVNPCAVAALNASITRRVRGWCEKVNPRLPRFAMVSCFSADPPATVDGSWMSPA